MQRSSAHHYLQGSQSGSLGKRGQLYQANSHISEAESSEDDNWAVRQREWSPEQEQQLSLVSLVEVPRATPLLSEHEHRHCLASFREVGLFDQPLPRPDGGEERPSI